MSGAFRDRSDLLAERALYGLDEPSELGLRAELREDFEAETASFERAAAALHLALLETTVESMPARLRARLERSGPARSGRGSATTDERGDA